MMTTDVNTYLVDGCGRCPLGGTPGCKVNRWRQELKLLRQLLLSCGLDEASKWGVPCYMHKGKNIVIMAAFKDYASLSFFKGSLLSDPQRLLRKPGGNTQDARSLKFTKAAEIEELAGTIKAFVFEAIEVEQSGKKTPDRPKTEPEWPEEFKKAIAENPALKKAFEALTPGRQRGYLLHFSQPKQAKTRESRIGKCIPMILAGKGMQD